MYETPATAIAFMNTIKAQVEAEPRFMKLGGKLVLADMFKDSPGQFSLQFEAMVGEHKYVHSLNAAQYTQRAGSEHTTYGEFTVVMVTRYPKRFFGCPIDQKTQRLLPEGMDEVLKKLKSGLAKFKKTLKMQAEYEARKNTVLTLVAM